MDTGTRKRIRSLDDNPDGKVVSDAGGNRWQWKSDGDDRTTRLLRKLSNTDLALEPTGVVRKLSPAGDKRPANTSWEVGLDLDDTAVTSGGGFDPYNST